MGKPTWELFSGTLSAVLVFVVPIVLYLMEKAGWKIVWIFAVGWSAIAIASVYLVLCIPWVWSDTGTAVRLWRGYLVCSSVLLLLGYGAIKVWPHEKASATDSASSSKSGDATLKSTAFARNFGHEDGEIIAGFKWDKKEYAEINLRIFNGNDSLIQNIDLKAQILNDPENLPGVIWDMGQESNVQGCEFRAPQLHSNAFFRLTPKQGDAGDSAAVPFDDILSKMKNPSADRWEIFCPRMLGQTELSLVLAIGKKADRRAVTIWVVGTYETKEGQSVKVNERVPIQR
jgi:hypothetical protein